LVKDYARRVAAMKLAEEFARPSKIAIEPEMSAEQRRERSSGLRSIDNIGENR